MNPDYDDIFPGLEDYSQCVFCCELIPKGDEICVHCEEDSDTENPDVVHEDSSRLILRTGEGSYKIVAKTIRA
jgi:RNA polymerase subunit RPABC4/transcription elongation factor Spt4